MNILVTGATGFIGKHLVSKIHAKHQLTLVSRNMNKLQKLQSLAPNAELISWDQLDKNPEILAEIDTIIHLCGQSIFGIWTKRFIQKLYKSRIEPLRKLQAYCTKLSHSPNIICASGVGYYGCQLDCQNPPLLEESPIQTPSILSDVAVACENALSNTLQKKACYLRFGVVLDTSGGSLPLMMLPHYLGLGTVVGSGEQPLSWVSLKDAVHAIIFAIDHQLAGPYNIVTPEVYTNKRFNKELAFAMQRPCLLKLPTFIARLLGKMFYHTILTGQLASSEKIAKKGFSFEQPTVHDVIIKK